MITLRADWVLPIAGEPIRDGAVSIDRGRIAGVFDRPPEDSLALGRVAILPALVNAHTHLELSFLEGQVPPCDSFNEWVTMLMSLRRSTAPDPTAPHILEAAKHAVAQARRSGTGLIGDVSNTLAIVTALHDAAMPAHVFHELTGFNIPDVPGRITQARSSMDHAKAGLTDPSRASGSPRATSRGDIRISLAPHAPYSVSPALFKAIRRDVDGGPHSITSVHLGESAQEMQLLRDGTGPARAMLERLGVWTDAWHPPGVSPVTYLTDLGFIDARTLVVHGVQFDSGDLAQLRTAGATLVSCPRSNVYVGVGSPPLDAFYASGVPVAFGTDSLTSVADLNMFNELAEAHRIAPRVAARRLLESATLIAARALGFELDFGSIEAGKSASLIAVRVPAHVVDVEEYLVGGVEPEAITWLDQDA